jgi:uncharacterized GH25 family protein
MKLNTKFTNKKIKAKFFKPLYLFLAFILLCSHDLYIKMETYFLEPNQEATLSLYNGTFEKSENIITRDRMLDASIIAQGKRTAIDADNWIDQDSTITQLTFKTGESGTYVAGVSTKARNIELTAEKFNSYLKHDGVFDMLELRTKEGLLDQDALENYQKHVKAIYQVGDVKSDDWNADLGYPIEFIPQANPYDKYTGETLDVVLLHEGKPLANQLVFANYIKSVEAHSHGNESHDHEHDGETHAHEHSDDEGMHSHTHETASAEADVNNEHKHEHKHDGETHAHEHSDDDDKHSHTHQKKSEQKHTHTSGQQLRTNDKGIVTIKLPEDGIYYLRTIYMTRAKDSDELTHRSKWATLTFEVSHSHETNAHTHDHDAEGGFPIWVFILGSIVIIGVLFLIFRKKND